MIDCSQHVQEYLQIEGTSELTDDEVAAGVADVMFAQGLIELAEVDLAVHEIAKQVAYYR